MRKCATLSTPIEDNSILLKKLMIYQDDSDNVYLFLYDNIEEDSSCYADYWFENIQSAFDFVSEEYDVPEHHFIQIDNPLPYCQHDIVSPIRIKGRNIGKEDWGKFEKLIDGKWVPFTKKT